MEAGALGDVGEGLQNAGGALAQIAEARMRAVNIEKRAAAEMLFDQAEMDIAKQVAGQVHQPEQWEGIAATTLRNVYEATLKDASPALQRELKGDYQRRTAQVGRQIQQAATRQIFSNATGTLLANAQHKAEMGDVAAAKQVVRYSMNQGYLSDEAGEKRLTELDTQDLTRRLAEHDAAFAERLQSRDYEGAQQMAQAVGALDPVKSRVQLGLVQREQAHQGQLGIAQTEIDQDPMAFLEAAGRPGWDEKYPLLRVGDMDELKVRADQNYARLQTEEVTLKAKMVDEMDLSLLRKEKTLTEVKLADLPEPGLKYADDAQKSSLEHRLRVKQGLATMERPGLREWMRTEVKSYDAAADKTGTKQQYLKTLIGLNFAEKDAQPFLAELDQRAKGPREKVPLGDVYRQINRTIMGGTEFSYFTQREQGPGTTPGVRGSLLDSAPNGMAAKAFLAGQIKDEIDQQVTAGRITDSAQAGALAESLMAQKKSTSQREVDLVVRLARGDREADLPVPPGMRFDQAQGKLVSKYSPLRNEAWGITGSQIYGYQGAAASTDTTLEQVVQKGREEGLSHHGIALRIRAWRDEIQTKAATVLDDTVAESYLRGTEHLDEITHEMLGGLRDDAVQAWLLRTFAGDAARGERFITAWQKGTEPDKMGDLQQEAAEFSALVRDPVWQGPMKASDWRPMQDANHIEVGRYSFVRRGEDFDVALRYKDVDGGRPELRLHVTGVTPADLKREIQRAKDAAQSAQSEAAALRQRPVQEVYGERITPFTDGMPDSFKIESLERKRDEALARAAALGGDAGMGILFQERLMETVRASRAGARLGQADLGQDFVRGFASFYVNSRIAWNFVSQDDAEFEEWRDIRNHLRQMMPGSTGEQAGLLSEVSESLGAMAPQILAALASGGASAASSTAATALASGGGLLTASTLGTLGVSTYGDAVADAFNRADQLDADAKDLTQADSTLAAAKSAEAQSIRQNAWLIASAKTGVQMVAERILPEERLLLGLGKGTVTGKLLNRFGRSGLEGLAAELGDQAINNRVYGDALDAAALGKAAFMEAAVGSPLIVAGSLMPGHGHAGAASSSANQAGSPAPHPLGERLQFSQGEAGKAMRDLAADGSRFRRNASSNDPMANGPASQNTDLAKIVSDYDLGGEHLYVDETKAFNDPEAEVTYEIGVAQGGKAYFYKGKDGTLWLDLTEMRTADGGPVQGGDLVIQAAMTYAHNNKLRWRPDPAGSSEIAKVRGLSHMLSSALRHQTTEHLAPNATKDVATQQPVVRLPGWMEGGSREAYEHNVDLLASAEYEAVKEAMSKVKDGPRLEDLRWNPEDDTVTNDSTGSRLSERAFDEIVSRLDPGRSGVGPTTLSRALNTQAALQGYSLESDGVRSQIIAEDHGRRIATDRSGNRLLRLLEREKFFYSQPDAAGNTTLGSQLGHSHQLGQQVAETVGYLNQRVPGLLNERTQIFATTEDLLNSDYARSHSFTAEQRADIDTAEGFHDRATGKSIVIASNVVLRPGETPRTALTRVLLHESVGHGGLNAWLGTDKGRKARWEALIQQIPQDQLDAIGAEDDYRRLQTNRPALALEWFSRQAEKGGIESIQKQPLLREMWENVKAAVQELYLKVGLPLPKGKAFDLEVQSLLRQARKQALPPSAPSAHTNENSSVHDASRDPESLQFSLASYAALPQREDKPASWQDVKRGHHWKSTKQFLPRTGDKVRMSPLVKRGTFEERVANVARWLMAVPPVRDPWGTKVIFNNPQEEGTQPNSIMNRAAHLIGENKNPKVENRTEDIRKITWLGSVVKTIEDAQARVIADNGNVLYFRNYADGVHMVVVEDGIVQDQSGLITQYAPESPKKKFEGARVERVRDVAGHKPL